MEAGADYVTAPDLRSWVGLRQIWFKVGATQQYYPLLHSAFWVEHAIWGNDPEAAVARTREVLGILRAALPADEVAILVLQVNFAGVLEFEGRQIVAWRE